MWLYVVANFFKHLLATHLQGQQRAHELSPYQQQCTRNTMSATCCAKPAVHPMPALCKVRGHEVEAQTR
jgi:hypothetical protein